MKNEARMRWEKRKKYEALLEDHPAVKAMRARIAPRRVPEVKPGHACMQRSVCMCVKGG